MANRRFIDFPIATTVGDNDIILIWQSGMNKQTTKATLLNGLPENLEDLLDVNITGLTNGQILRYDSVTGKWENTDQGNLDLDDLNDVTIVSPTNGQVLVYNSSTSKWENSSGGFVPYTGAISTVNLGAQTIQAGSFVKAGGTSSQFLKADGSVDSTAYGTGSVTSVALTMPSAFNVANSPITTSGTLAVTGAGTVGQYIRGDGSLADFPASTGGGSSVSYYLNGSVSQGTIGGVAYKELSKTPILGSGTQFTINADGYIASFLTDAGDPNLLEIPGGNWNFETYFSASSGGGSPTFYVELYKYDGSTFTLIASNSGSPELIAFGTNVNSYFSTLAVPTTALTLTDRLAIRYYVTHSGRTITLHTENNTLCQIITTFTTGLTALNGLTAQVQYFAVGTSGTDFNIASATQTHTFNLPTASASNRGALSSADWSTFNAKQNALTLTTSGSSGASTLVGATLNVPTYTLSGLGGVPTSRQLTINGTAFDLSADRSWTVGTVTSVGLSSATSGVTIGNTPVTGSGTITLAIATATSTQQGLLSSTDWSTFNNKQNAITLTTTGTSGAATLVGATLNIPQYQAAGTYVTSVTASSPLASSGGTTPNITIQQASGSQSGFLSSTDWTTFNNKQNALTNPVTGTGTTNYLPKFTGSTTIGNSAITDDGTSVNIISRDLTITRGSYSAFAFGIDQQSTFAFGSTNGRRVAIIRDSTAADNGLQFGYDTVDKTGIIAGAATSAGAGIDFYTFNGSAWGNRARVTASGNLLIGTTTDNGARLQVSGAIYASDELYLDNGKYLRFRRSSGNLSIQTLGIPSGTDDVRLLTTGDFNVLNGSLTNLMTVKNGGNVGIGTTSPSYRLVVNSGTDGISAGVAGSTYGIRFDNGGTFSSGMSTIHGVDSTLVGSYQPIMLNGLDVRFGTSANERMRITSGGNVGIGTSSPGYKLDVQNGSDFDIRLRDTSLGGTVGILFETGNDFSGTSQAFIKGIGAGNSGVSQLIFGTATNVGDTTASEKMRITSSGNVGIGTSSPNGLWSGDNRTLNILSPANFSSELVLSRTVGTVAAASVSNFLSGTTADFGFYTTAALNYVVYTSNTERMRITSGGNVLIGTTTDVAGANLNVNGNIRTAAPTGGNAANWRLGTARGGTITPNAIVRIEIGGVLVDLDARYV